MLGLLLAGRAQGFVPYRTQGTDLAFHWPRACIGLRVYVDDLPEMTPAQIMEAVRGAAAAWSAAANPCASMNVVVEQEAGPAPASKYDSINTISFRRTSWCPADPALGCYDPAALAISSVYVAKNTGEIRDVDIEVNAKNFLWGDLAMQPDGTKQDLQSTLTHEMGHVLGFDDSCTSLANVGDKPLDDMGSPSPSCDTASDAVRETTMFPSVIPGDTSKRNLAPDDQRAVCATYPVADAGAPPRPGVLTYLSCTTPLDGGADAGGAAAGQPVTDAQANGETGGHTLPPSQSGCDCSAGGSGPSWSAIVLALLFVLRRRSGKVRLTL